MRPSLPTLSARERQIGDAYLLTKTTGQRVAELDAEVLALTNRLAEAEEANEAAVREYRRLVAPRTLAAEAANSPDAEPAPTASMTPRKARTSEPMPTPPIVERGPETAPEPAAVDDITIRQWEVWLYKATDLDELALKAAGDLDVAGLRTAAARNRLVPIGIRADALRAIAEVWPTVPDKQAGFAIVRQLGADCVGELTELAKAAS